VFEKPDKRSFLRRTFTRTIDQLRLRHAYNNLRARAIAAVGSRRLKSAIGRSPLKIVIGANGIAQDGWIPTEKAYLDLLDIDDWERKFGHHRIDALLAEHVWEHLSLEDGIVAAKTCFKYLKPGGHLRIAVPDANHPDPNYIEYVRPGGCGPGAEEHKILYDYKLLSKTISQAGFKVKLLEYFDERKQFVFQPWKPEDGMVLRSYRYDDLNRDGKPNYTSLIVDAYVP
jgi:predicted SAM-dependent methyltransferase